MQKMQKRNNDKTAKSRINLIVIKNIISLFYIKFYILNVMAKSLLSCSQATFENQCEDSLVDGLTILYSKRYFLTFLYR